MKEKGKSNLFPFGLTYERAIALFEMRTMQGKAGAKGKGPSFKYLWCAVGVLDLRKKK